MKQLFECTRFFTASIWLTIIMLLSPFAEGGTFALVGLLMYYFVPSVLASILGTTWGIVSGGIIALVWLTAILELYGTAKRTKARKATAVG